ncbi:LppM family (lipo)protein [Symbiobacterium thermophilum]|uniref:LppM family (lipo)protein n=1 Tax=Symbiobacterium thermophilum TaxID=2734 RepID=UPI0035C67E65
MRRLSALTLVLLLAAAALAGCVRLELNLRVNPDGTGEKEIIAAIDREFLAVAAAMRARDPLVRLEAELREDPKATVTRYQLGDMVGFRAVAPFRNELILNDETWKGHFLIRDRIFWRDYTLDLETLLDMAELDAVAASFDSPVDFRVSVELPARIGETNGELDPSGRKVTWTLIPGRRDHLVLTARQYLYGRIAAAGAAALAAAVGLAFGIRRGQRRRRPVGGIGQAKT